MIAFITSESILRAFCLSRLSKCVYAQYAHLVSDSFKCIPFFALDQFVVCRLMLCWSQSISDDECFYYFRKQFLALDQSAVWCCMLCYSQNIPDDGCLYYFKKCKVVPCRVDLLKWIDVAFITPSKIALLEPPDMQKHYTGH